MTTAVASITASTEFGNNINLTTRTIVTDRRANIFNNILPGFVLLVFFPRVIFFYIAGTYHRIPILNTARTHYQKTGTNFHPPPLLHRRSITSCYGRLKPVARIHTAGSRCAYLQEKCCENVRVGTIIKYS